MKWKNHALMAGSLAVLLNLYPLEIAYSVLASHLPDQMEKIAGHRVISHRTWTHEVLLWLFPLLLVQLFPQWLPGQLSLSVGNVTSRYLSFRIWVLFMPGLFHLAGDLFTPGGIRLGGRKMSLKLFKTGDALEYVVTSLFVLLAVLHGLNGSWFLSGT